MPSTFMEAQIGFGVESTVGTRVAPTLFLPFRNETLENTIDYIQDPSYRAGRKYPSSRRPVAQRTKGNILMSLAPQGLQIILRQMLGNLVTTGAGPYVHTVTPGALVGQSLTVQKVLTFQGGTQQPFDYAGVKFTDWEIAANVGEIATLNLGCYGIKAEDTGQSIATATYPTNWLPFSCVEISLTIGGTATDVKSLSIKGDVGLLTERFRLSTTTPTQSREPIESAVHAVTGTLDADFTSLTAYNRFINQTQGNLVITLAQASGHQLVITSSVEFDGQTAQATGLGNELRQPLPFVGINATSDANVITMALTNADATP